MGLHFLFALKCFITNCALVTLGTIVLDTMQLKNVIVAKVTEANIAMIWLFARMGT